MTEQTFGPVEFYVVSLPGESPTREVMAALGELVENETVRLLDLVVLSKSTDGELTVTEFEDAASEYGLDTLELIASGIAGDADIDEFAHLVAPGTSAALAALELSWARRLAGSVSSAGAEVLAVERIPAPVVNALVDFVNAEQE